MHLIFKTPLEFRKSCGYVDDHTLTLKNPDPHFHRNTWRMSYLQCYTETWRNAHLPYFLCFSDTWRMSYLQSVQNQCILHQSLRRLKLLKYLENVIFARKCHMCHSPGLTRSQLNKCHKSYNNNNTVLAWLKLSYMPRSGYLGVKIWIICRMHAFNDL